MMNFSKSLASGSLIALLAFNTACTDREVAITAGAIAIGAGAVVIGATIDHDRRSPPPRGGRYYCEGGYRTVCTRYRDYYGHWRNDCRSVYDACHRRVYRSHSTWSNPDLISKDLIDALNVDSNPEAFKAEWAKSFMMSHEAAEEMIRMLVEARDGNPDQLLTLGLSKEDMKNLMDYKIPTDNGLDKLAQVYNQDVDSTKAMMIRIIEKAKDLKKN